MHLSTNDKRNITSKQKMDLYQTVDDPSQPKPSSEDAAYVSKYLLKELPRADSKAIVRDLGWKFHLARNFPTPHAKNLKRKKTFLTRKQRLQLEILKLPKTGWDYDSLETMRNMWLEYMEENLNLAGAIPSTCDADWAPFSAILAKSELIGAEVVLVRSKNILHVGLSGTIVLETKQTFQIVTRDSKLKRVGKDCSVFVIEVNGIKFTLFGKHLVMRPHERSIKKIRNQMMPDL